MLSIDSIQPIADVIRIGINIVIDIVIDIVMDKGTEHSVPAGQNVAVVAVGPRKLEMMMKFVHVRRNDDPTERPVQVFRQADVGVGEVGKNWRNNPV